MTKSNTLVHFNVITLFPELITQYLNDALLAKAIQKNLISVSVTNLRSFADGKYKAVDDTVYGGSDGMVFLPEVLEKALLTIIKSSNLNRRVIYLSPQGKVWNNQRAKEMAQSFLNISESSLTSNLDEVVLICGRYAGLDQRFIQKYTDEEISVGDYILSGGELAALILIETISRFVPGVLGDEASSSQDSFENNWLEAPQFTKPQVWQDLQVPQVLTSGHHAKIVEWKHFCSILVTLKKRPDLFHRQFKNEKISLSEIKNFYELLSRKEKEILQIQDLNFDGINL